ncbi:ParB family chromosome partitioning protein [Clostridium beijerinckii]|uniref:ParB/RepB/Spo0J family partition protein n=1 Tax=Clostridium beijerinckii TaxID=1520 RepID=UPI00156E145D|nr:ParB N-terminal domain-containing protein [Clostridium beijerinckii]NRT32414.1 ParB family chromosome partitioning protein [Clostridium beijerinckii]NRT48158.1 ParB family chromosome partitioning protein [Clostridium beijerinckii]NRZ23545.1 ParB family chromosome partitioning protein [Clostridium beijerinckii]
MSSYLKGLADKINGVENKSFTQELDINLLVPSSSNFYGIREIEDLAESIKENGLMHNLVVRKKDDGTYEIISGERRYRALKSLGYEKIPCQVKENLNDLDAELMLIQANAEQRELTPSEKMEGIKRLEAIYKKKRNNGEKLQGKTRDLIGKDLGLSGVQVGRYKKVDKDLIPDLKEKLDKEEITLTQAHTLSSLSESEQKVIHEEIKDLNAKESKEEIEVLVQGIKQPIESKLDKDLLQEMYPDKALINKAEEKKNSLSEKYLTKIKKKPDSKEDYITDIRQKLSRMLEYDLHPTVIIKDNKFNVFFYNVEQVLILDREIRGHIPGSVLNLYTKCICEIDEIPGVNEDLFKGSAYKLNEGVYLYFSNYSSKMRRLYKRGLIEINNQGWDL